MIERFNKVEEKLTRGYLIVKHNLTTILLNERGDVTTVGILGWAAVIITLIVAAHGLLTGWLPDFVNAKIFDRANQL